MSLFLDKELIPLCSGAREGVCGVEVMREATWEHEDARRPSLDASLKVNTYRRNISGECRVEIEAFPVICNCGGNEC